MVQMYNPNVVGKQVIIDVKNIESDRLKTIANIQPLMDKVVEEFKLSVVAKSEFQFEKDNVPYGCTIMYLLSESHLFVHTFVDEGKITLDLFTCSLGAEFDKLKNIIKDYFNVNVLCIDSYYFTRGN